MREKKASIELLNIEKMEIFIFLSTTARIFTYDYNFDDSFARLLRSIKSMQILNQLLYQNILRFKKIFIP